MHGIPVKTKWCNFTADETLDDNSQPSWHTPEFTSSNMEAVNSGMALQVNLVTVIVSLKFILNIYLWRNDFCSGLVSW